MEDRKAGVEGVVSGAGVGQHWQVKVAVASVYKDGGSKVTCRCYEGKNKYS